MQISFSRHLIQLSINPADSSAVFTASAVNPFFLVKSFIPIGLHSVDKSPHFCFCRRQKRKCDIRHRVLPGRGGGLEEGRSALLQVTDRPGRGGGSAALLVRLRRPTLHRAARYGRGPSLRCVHRRRTCSLLLCSRKGVRSHPLRGACRACCAGQKRFCLYYYGGRTWI